MLSSSGVAPHDVVAEAMLSSASPFPHNVVIVAEAIPRRCCRLPRSLAPHTTLSAQAGRCSSASRHAPMPQMMDWLRHTRRADRRRGRHGARQPRHRPARADRSLASATAPATSAARRLRGASWRVRASVTGSRQFRAPPRPYAASGPDWLAAPEPRHRRTAAAILVPEPHVVAGLRRALPRATSVLPAAATDNRLSPGATNPVANLIPRRPRSMRRRATSQRDGVEGASRPPSPGGALPGDAMPA